MPAAIQLTSGYYTAAAAGTGTATPMTGDTFTVPSFTLSSPAYLEQVWASGADTDFVRIRSPRMHDANQGIRLITGSGNLERSLLPGGTNQPLYPSDTPIVEIDQTAAATGAICALYGFTDLPGVNPQLSDWAGISGRIAQISGVQVNLGAVGAIGAYSAGNAINSTYDNFEAGASYALLGYEVSSACLAIAVQGQDTGNLKMGGPGSADPFTTRDWFIRLSRESGRAYIPIINANNKGSTNVYQTDSSAHAAQNVTLIMAELS